MDDAAIDEHLSQLAESLRSVSETNRLSLRVRVAALQDAIDSPPKNLSPEDVKAFQERGAAQLAALQKDHNAIPVEFDLEHHRKDSMVARFACPDHTHDDSDWYTHVHDASCSGTADCGCS
jgi:hypothetical protein